MNTPALPDSGWKRRAGLFLASQNVSLFGSSVVSFAIMWHITLETSSGLWMTLATLCSMLPQVIVSLWGGVWADRYSRKLLIMLADGFIAFATLGLAIAFLAGFRRLELLLAVSAVRSIGAGIQSPAVNALYPQLVPQESLTKVQGINQSLSSVLLLLSPAVGGVLLGSVGIVWAFFTDVITAIAAIVIMSRINVEKAGSAATGGSVFAELKQGLAYTFGHKLIRRLVLFFGLSFFLITPAAVLTPLMVERSFGSEVWRLTANEIVWTVGSLAGGIFVAVKGSFKNKTATSVICLFAFGVAFALLGVAPYFWLYLVLMGAAGLFMPPLSTVMTVWLQEITEPNMLGRVFSVLQIVSGSAMPLAILFLGPLADVISVETILMICGAALAVSAVTYGLSMKKAQL